MAKDKTKTDPNYRVIAENRRARYDYAIEDDLECGIVLQGSEVKSLRENSANIAESYAAVEEGELWLVNSYIAPYERRCSSTRNAAAASCWSAARNWRGSGTTHSARA